MANEYKDVIRVDTSSGGLPAVLRNLQLGFENTGFNRMGHKRAAGTMDYWSPDGSVFATGIQYTNVNFPAWGSVADALDELATDATIGNVNGTGQPLSFATWSDASDLTSSSAVYFNGQDLIKFSVDPNSYNGGGFFINQTAGNTFFSVTDEGIGSGDFNAKLSLYKGTSIGYAEDIRLVTNYQQGAGQRWNSYILTSHLGLGVIPPIDPATGPDGRLMIKTTDQDTTAMHIEHYGTGPYLTMTTPAVDNSTVIEFSPDLSITTGLGSGGVIFGGGKQATLTGRSLSLLMAGSDTFDNDRVILTVGDPTNPVADMTNSLSIYKSAINIRKENGGYGWKLTFDKASGVGIGDHSNTICIGSPEWVSIFSGQDASGDAQLSGTGKNPDSRAAFSVCDEVSVIRQSLQFNRLQTHRLTDATSTLIPTHSMIRLCAEDCATSAGRLIHVSDGTMAYGSMIYVYAADASGTSDVGAIITLDNDYEGSGATWSTTMPFYLDQRGVSLIKQNGYYTGGSAWWIVGNPV